jgi:UDP-N-acetylglucosamine--N-acetylmuramyl-(pentapeptide) pyrophosphoryl-undecaprenol N-acetylglucosamine transferase
MMPLALRLRATPVNYRAEPGTRREAPNASAAPRSRAQEHQPPIVIAAGGTGGHLFPAEALASELLRRGRRIVLLTDARSAATSSDVFAGHERFVISGAGIAGRGVARGLSATMALAAGVAQARRILVQLRPAALVAFGGYPSIPPLFAARLLRSPPPIVLHEQNAVLGRANRLFARYADLVALSFARTQRVPAGCRTNVTGNPVRAAISDMRPTDYRPPEGRIRLLVLGGSLGARVFSNMVPPAIAALPHTILERLEVTQQCRPEDLDRVRTAYDALGIPAELSSFFPNIAERLLAAHLVIARSGASTVAELAVAGRPAILVPLPGAIDDHQSANASALAAVGAAMVVPERDLTPAALCAQLADWLGAPDKLITAANAALLLARADAAARLADAVEALLTEPASPGERG